VSGRDRTVGGRAGTEDGARSQDSSPARSVLATAPPLHGRLLCIETSCDDTSAAVVEDGRVFSSVVSSQNELHAAFGGIVPEIASRHHVELLPAVIAEALDVGGTGWGDLRGVTVTTRPGLIGALLVGLSAAKAIAYARRLPLVPVNHLEGHIAAAYAVSAQAPFVCLIASGGHTLLAVVDEGVRMRVAGQTLDDAAGEAFDKGARLLGLGYPGGAELDRLARDGDPTYARFPRAVPRGRDLSFSGLKTALLYDLRERRPDDIGAHRADIAASYQAAIVRQLVEKTVACAQAEGVQRIALAGGVAANEGLRGALAAACAQRDLELFLPDRSLCTDNAAMIGLAAAHLPAIPWPDYLALDAQASSGLPARPRQRRSNRRAPRG
jgi:N6-L-threonylcarbamoyladenine synthase